MVVIPDGFKIRELRKSIGKTQAQMAESADITDRYIRDLEAGRKRDPSARIVYGCAAFLGVAMEELMMVVEEEKQDDY